MRQPPLKTAAVIRFPGSNCDADTAHALELCGWQTCFVWHRETDLGGAELVVIPGGFSYGDYLRSGALAAHSPIMGAVTQFAEGGGLVLGICNGFQILTEAGLLPGQLARNAGLHFSCKTVALRVERADTPFTSAYEAGQVIRLPVAHAEGSYYADAETLAGLERNNRVVLRYCSPNPNGSLNSVAAIVNERGNVLGMMPHPERAVEALLGGTDGLGLFASLGLGSPEIENQSVI